MHFCITAQYTPAALNAIMENPTTNRQEVIKKVLESNGGKLISMCSTAADGPGVLAIFEVADPAEAATFSAVVTASGTVQNVQLTRLLTQEEVSHVRQTAATLRAAYKPPGK
jgi:uncharacterized protein with GYD domain